MSKFYNNKQWRADVKKKELSRLKEIYPKFYNELQKHTQKYCWVYYVYAGPAYIEYNFLEFIRDYLYKGVNPKKKLALLAAERKKLLSLRKQCIAKLKPDKFYSAILRLAEKIVWAKPRRKDFQSKAYYYLEKLQREIGRRLYLSLDQVRSCTLEMMEEGLKGKKISLEKIKMIKEWHGCMPENGAIKVITGKEAEKFYNKFLKSETTASIKKVKILKGTCAFAGYAKGKIKIINRPEDMVKMKYGDVLLSIATTPAIVPAMKKAAAIITDEGGLTCHASIVSRELKIPCVVGLKIASKILKDEDKVEVDAGAGVVQKI
ncbi:MAG: PEP-utilizing enzyme [Patescibacteria group bacterium]